MGPFEIDKAMIAGLGDEQLRALLGRLLEAEAKARGIPIPAISVGGNQTAGDGGVDASIGWKGSPAPSGWLPRRTIFFQAKAEVIGPAALTKEMRPKGLIRPIFSNLAKIRGAYIIVSTDDPSPTGFDRRLTAMRAATAELAQADRIHFDFYGADKIARWANQHPGVAFWLREQAGRSLGGWRPYGNWSGGTEGDQRYVADDSLRASVDGTRTTIASAIITMRNVLREPGGIVRLVGISGMGKTRLAEALFDGTIEPPGALVSSRAIYADAGLELAVGAALVAEQIAHDASETIIVVDNCRVRAHGQLAEIISRPPSRASLLTIDYDVAGEKPAGVLVSLDVNSEDMLRALIARRFPALDAREVHHLARFSGGNARIALKVAAAGGQGVDLSTLNDDELLSRLFQTDRQEPDPLARRCAEVAALVYAFYVEEGDGQALEYGVLAQIAGMSPDDFHYRIATFLEWGIVQQRGPQRAVMPPPLANMLAAPFVRRSAPRSLLAIFASGPPRLVASFARRLGQLHAEPAAATLARALYAPNGMLGHPETLDEAGRRGFIMAAPAAPDDALAAIERALAGPQAIRLTAPKTPQREAFALLLVHLGHDALRFERAMAALLKFVLAGGETPKDDMVRRYLLERFWPRLCFTLAPQPARLCFLDMVLADPEDRIRALGIEAVDHMLDAGNFSSSIDMDFGARSLATEWQPGNNTGYRRWFSAAYDRAVAAATGGEAEAGRARAIIARHFRSHMYRDLIDLPISAMRQVRGSAYWDEGWRAVNDALHFERERLSSADLALVETLERDLRPKTLDETFEAFVLGKPWRHWHPSGRERRSQRDVAILAQAVGRRLARSGDDIAPYLTQAAAATDENSIGAFTAGLARSLPDLDALWDKAYRLLAAAPPGNRPARLVIGLLASAARRDRGWYEKKLDAAVSDPTLAEHLVALQTRVPLDEIALQRFTRALAGGAATADQFHQLIFGGVTKQLDGSALAAFLRVLYEHEDGISPAIQVLHMRMFGDSGDGVPIDPALMALGEAFLTDARSYTEDVSRQDHGLTEIAEFVLTGEGARSTATAICHALRASDRADRAATRYFGELCMLLMKRFPRVVLDEILGSGEDDEHIIGRFFGGWARNDDDVPRTPVEMDEAGIIGWMREAPQVRAERLAPFIPYFTVDAPSGELRWSPLARALISAAPNPVPVLEALVHRFSIGSGSGPWSLRLVRRRPLLAALLDQDDPTIRDWAKDAEERLETQILHWDEVDRDRDSRFE